MNTKETRWQSRTCTHLLLRELQNCNSLLNNHRQENVGPHKKKGTPPPRAKEKPQEDSRSVEIMLGIVSYKLALTKSIANDWTTVAFAICPYENWTPCCYSCWSSTPPEGVQGGVRPSVLQGIWWDRSLDSWVFLETDFMISISSYLEKH